MARKKQPASNGYDVHPSIAYARSVLDNIPEKTGKSFAEWAELIKKSGPPGTKERRAWLKKEYKLGNTSATLLLDHIEGRDGEHTDPEAYLRLAPQYVAEMYAGQKSALKPIHDALIGLGRALGPDVKVCPCQTMVPLYRNHVFAQIKPATLKRIDFGLALKGAKGKLPARLIDTGGLAKGDRITHRFAITSVADIDAEVRKWLQVAYDLDG